MRSFHKFSRQWQNWLGLILILFFIIVASAAPWISPQDPTNPGVVKIIGNPRDFQPHPPGPDAPLGTLPKQISVFHSLVWGTRSVLVFGLSVALFSMAIGILVGATSAYFGGTFNNIVMRITDAFLAFPLIAGVVLIKQLYTILMTNAGIIFSTAWSVFGTERKPFEVVTTPEGIPNWILYLQQSDPLSIAFILFSWMPYARVMNAVVLSAKKMDYVLAARALGAKHSRIIFKHLIPNTFSPAIVMAARDVGSMVLLQATFIFIGVSGNSPWGMLLVNGRDWIISPGGILTYWWVFLPATIALVLFGIAWNLVGDGLNDMLNPRTSDI